MLKVLIDNGADIYARGYRGTLLDAAREKRISCTSLEREELEEVVKYIEVIWFLSSDAILLNNLASGTTCRQVSYHT